jgi:hypothetical protein
MGDTSIGRHGKKNLCSLNGEKNAMPNPPFVMASSISCVKAQMKNARKSIKRLFAVFSMLKTNREAINASIRANRILWENPR